MQYYYVDLKRELSPPVIEGSRPAVSAATFWIMMKTLGKEGYAKNIKKLQNITDKFKESLETLKEVQILNEPELPLLIFTINNKKAITRQFLDNLNEKGYHLDCLQKFSLPDFVTFCDFL